MTMPDLLDLVDEMVWEDSDKVEFVTLYDAGLELNDSDTVPAAMRVYFDDESK